MSAQVIIFAASCILLVYTRKTISACYIGSICLCSNIQNTIQNYI